MGKFYLLKPQIPCIEALNVENFGGKQWKT